MTATLYRDPWGLGKALSNSPKGLGAFSVLQMKQVQAGFTLVELMIVITIISILSAIAVPAYKDYSLRARVSEAASLSGAAKLAVDMAYNEGYALGSIPSQTSLGLSAPGSYRSKYVLNIATDPDGVVTVRLTSDFSLSDAASGTLTYTPGAQGGNLSWTSACSFSGRICPRD